MSLSQTNHASRANAVIDPSCNSQAGAPLNTSSQEGAIMSWFWHILFGPEESLSRVDEHLLGITQLQVDLDQQNRKIRDLASAIVEALDSNGGLGC
jgi:hypothetical protein